MSRTVKVNVNTAIEAYPVLGIREAEDGAGHAYEIPASLLDALGAAEDAVRAVEITIMERIAAEHPEAEEVVEWLRDYASDE
jgi:hypothetical protein